MNELAAHVRRSPDAGGVNRYLRADRAVAAEVFVEPAAEVRWLVRHLRSLVAPRAGQSTRAARLLGLVVVAPFTQLTFLNWDLQAFLFEVFHRSRVARAGHFVFMAAVNFFAMAGLACSGPGASAAYAVVLLAWYALVARSVRMGAWWAVMVLVVAGLKRGADAFGAAFALASPERGFWSPTPLAYNPWLWMIVSAALVAASHAAEAKQPPRVVDADTWRSLPEYFREAGRSPRALAARVARMLLLFVTGTVNELWASPRLLPYNVLMAMFWAGYRPDASERLRGYVERALASGNPAIDFVGVGGGAWLREPEEP